MRARKHFAQAGLILAKSPAHAVKAPALMAAAYGSILERTLAIGFAPPRERIKPSRVAVLLALLRYGFA